MAKNQSVLIDIGHGLSIMAGFPTIPIWTTKQRPKNVQKGTLGFNTDIQTLEYYDGKNWLSAKMQEDLA